MGSLLSQHQDAVQRLAEVPAWEWTQHNRSLPKSALPQQPFLPPQGNRHMRRILSQAANAAVKAKGSIFEIVYRRSVPRLGHKQTIGAIAHRQCRLIWLLLHQGVRYEERGPAVTKQSKQRRTSRMIRQLRSLGYRIEPPNPHHPTQTQAQ